MHLPGCFESSGLSVVLAYTRYTRFVRQVHYKDHLFEVPYESAAFAEALHQHLSQEPYKMVLFVDGPALCKETT